MRHLVTFILRLWVDSESSPAACEGQVECVATGEQSHIRSQAEAAHFIKTHLDRSSGAKTSRSDDERAIDAT